MSRRAEASQTAWGNTVLAAIDRRIAECETRIDHLVKWNAPYSTLAIHEERLKIETLRGAKGAVVEADASFTKGEK